MTVTLFDGIDLAQLDPLERDLMRRVLSDLRSFTAEKLAASRGPALADEATRWLKG